MNDMTVAEFRANFPSALNIVKEGGEVSILYGRSHRPVAKLVPYANESSIKLGMLEGKGNITFVGDGKITAEEFLGI